VNNNMWRCRIEMQGINALPAFRFGEKMVAMPAAYPRDDGVESDRELIPEDACSLHEGLWRMAQLVQRPSRK
jgi:hypothetical protein